MNRLLVIIVVILVPIAIMSENESQEPVFKGDTMENVSLEIPVQNNEETIEKENTLVLVSNNKDKSDPYKIDLEEYIIGVVAGEMPASFQMEALKAQAVASRTYALYKMQNIKGYVLSTNINDQVYLTKNEMQAKWGSEFQYYYDRIKEAVDSTRGEVITYNGDIIIAYYFAISNGYTDNASVVFNETRDYLVSVSSEWDKNYQSYASNYTLTREEFCSKLNLNCNDIVISNVVRSDSNYVREITINNVKFSGLEVFKKLNLKSTDFSITTNGNNVVIKTYGFGHSVGMSQYGAQGMATEGYNYKDILKHYYRNTQIQNF